MIADVTAHGIFTLCLDGWDYQSWWGWDPALETLYAQLTHNSSDRDAEAEGPQIWISPPAFPRILLPTVLAQEIAHTTGAELAAVHAAMNADLPEGPHPFRLPDTPAGPDIPLPTPEPPQVRRRFWNRSHRDPAPRRPVTVPEPGSQGRISSVNQIPGGSREELVHQLHDFLDDTVECTGAFNVVPTEKTASGATLPPFFVVLIEPDITDPYLRAAFALVDQLGGVPAAEQMIVAASWTLMDDGGEICLVKLKLEFHHPWTARTDIAFLAANYAQWWHAIAGGGLAAITTRPRLKAAGGLEAGYFPLNACLPVEVASSPALQHLVASRGWPTRRPDKT